MPIVVLRRLTPRSIHTQAVQVAERTYAAWRRSDFNKMGFFYIRCSRRKTVADYSMTIQHRSTDLDGWYTLALSDLHSALPELKKNPYKMNNLLFLCPCLHRSPTKLCPDLVSFASWFVTKFWSFARKSVPDLVIRVLNCARFCVVCAVNRARILVVRALDCARFLNCTPPFSQCRALELGLWACGLVGAQWRFGILCSIGRFRSS